MKRFKHFSSKENFGDFSKMDESFMSLMDTIRDLYDYPWVVHCGWSAGTGHSKTSYHYDGLAMDFHVENLAPLKALERLEQILVDMEINTKMGLGFYPDWANPGFHLDSRGWNHPGRKAQPGTLWVRLDHDNYGYRKGYHYGTIAEKIIDEIKQHGL